MGFKADSTRRRRKTAPQKANPLQMLLIFIALGFSVWLGAWLPLNVRLGDYVPIPANWYTPILPNVPIRPIQIAVGVVAFILLQFVIVLISGLLFPLPPQEEFDKDGMYKRK
jgi:hypothetical protein